MPADMDMPGLAASITRAASLQTYATVRLLVDRPHVGQAFQAYAYFRWVDDWLDEPSRQRSDRLSFIRRQASLIDQCYSASTPRTRAPEEDLVISLIQIDRQQNGGLHLYIQNMLAVMAFDAQRRGRLISSNELAGYQRALATAVTEALHYFIGHDSPSPRSPARNLAAEGAHIAHMLRDTIDDIELGYFNIPREVVKAHGISPFDIDHPAYRSWVGSRVRLARSCFQAGRVYLSQVKSLRCRLAGYAYMARFESVLDAIERDGCLLRPEYRESKGPKAAQMGWSILWSAFTEDRLTPQPRLLPTR
jgi:phytoene/squalene synthetase